MNDIDINDASVQASGDNAETTRQSAYSGRIESGDGANVPMECRECEHYDDINDQPECQDCHVKTMENEGPAISTKLIGCRKEEMTFACQSCALKECHGLCLAFRKSFGAKKVNDIDASEIKYTGIINPGNWVYYTGEKFVCYGFRQCEKMCKFHGADNEEIICNADIRKKDEVVQNE